MRLSPRRRASVVLLVVAGAAAVGCASQGMPPGGPPDIASPVLLKVSPESGAVNATPKAVTFRFDEVVSERPRGAPSLEQLVLLSPSDGIASVDWGRNELVVRPQHGWRPNTAYSVTVLPGLTDLRGNAATRPFRTVFSTGPTIPNAVIRGVAFDLMGGKALPSARIEAIVGSDTILRYSAAADSVGRFSLGTLPASTFIVRAWIDANNNGIRDPREAWDSITVSVSDSARHDLYMFPHDTLGARIADVTVADSVTIRLRFDHGLKAAITVAQLRLFRSRDSADVAIASVLPAGQADSSAIREKAAREDSLLRADTSAKGRQARARADSTKRVRALDSLARAQNDSIRAARDTTRRAPPPKFERTVPPTDFVVKLTAPLPFEVAFRLSARDVQALSGPARTSERPLQLKRPPPIDSTALKRALPPRDTLATKRPPPRRR